MCGTTEHSPRPQEAETTPCGSMPTRSNGEAPVVRHNPVTEGLVTRRNFVKGSALVCVGVSAFFGVGAITALYKKSSQEQERRNNQSFAETRNEIWERLRESGEMPDPMKVRLAVVALNAAGIEPVKSPEDIRAEVTEQTRHISTTTRGQFTFETNYHEETEQPDRAEERSGQTVLTYSREQMMSIASRYDAPGEASMVLLLANSADAAVGDDSYSGKAIRSEATSPPLSAAASLVVVLSDTK